MIYRYTMSCDDKTIMVNKKQLMSIILTLDKSKHWIDKLFQSDDEDAEEWADKINTSVKEAVKMLNDLLK